MMVVVLGDAEEAIQKHQCMISQVKIWEFQ